MRVKPGSIDQIAVDWGSSGAVIGVRVLDNSGATYAARVVGFVEYPAGSGVYYLDPFTFPEDEGSYTLLYDDDGGTAAVGHVAVEELDVSFAAPDDVAAPVSYVTREELARILKITNPSGEQLTAMDRVLTAAAGEINSEIGVEPGDELSAWGLALCQEVNLERAVEHWRQQESPFGIVGLGAELGGTLAARDSWDRHAYKLAPLKHSWGLA